MSSDNFIAIVKKGRGYVGYCCCASLDHPYVKCYSCLGHKKFITTDLRHAIDLAQAENTEYGCSIYDWKDEHLSGCPCEIKRFFQGVLTK